MCALQIASAAVVLIELMNADRTVRIRTKPFQEPLNGGYCGPSSLKIVLEYYGVKADLNEIAQLCHLHPTLGVTDSDLSRAADHYGFSVYVKNFATLADIRRWLSRDIPVIVNWITAGRPEYRDSVVPDGHYSVVCAITATHIVLEDPEIGGKRRIKRDDFERVWFDFRGSRIEAWRDMVIRQIIVIQPKSMSRGRLAA